MQAAQPIDKNEGLNAVQNGYLRQHGMLSMLGQQTSALPAAQCNALCYSYTIIVRKTFTVGGYLYLSGAYSMIAGLLPPCLT